MDPNLIDEQLKESFKPKETIKFVGSPRTAKDTQVRDFSQKIGKNYYDDELQVNKPPEPNKLEMEIQQQIANINKKLVLLEPEHQKAMQKYLKLCYRDQVLPLPILSKIDAGVLALEDYTIRQPQIQSLNQVIKYFSQNAFRKVYLNNNGLNDTEMAEFLQGFTTNKNINQLEIAYNRVQDYGIRAICSFFENKRITVLKMMQTKTN